MIDEDIHLSDYVAVITKHKTTMIIGILISLMLALLATWLSDPIWESKAQLLVDDRQSASGGRTSGDAYQGILTSERLAKTYSSLATRHSLLEDVAHDLKIPESASALQERVKVEPLRDTQLMVVTAQYPDPQIAAAIANGVGKSLSQEVERLELAKYADGSNVSVRVTLVEAATPSKKPVRPRPIMNIILGLILGSIGSVLIVLIRDHLDTTIKSASDLQQLIGEVPILAQIPIEDQGRADRLIAKSGTDSIAAEAFRSLRTNISYVNYEGSLAKLLITSSKPGEGKTTLCLNLGATLAQAGHKVLIIGADLRRPRLLEGLGLRSNAGLSKLLLGASSLEEAIIKTTTPGLSVLPSGPVPPNPSELLGSHRMMGLLTAVSSEYDFILIDTPPILAVTDAMVVSGMVDGVIMVARSGVTEREAIKHVLSEFRQSKARLIGAVLNGVTTGVSYGYYQESENEPRSGFLRGFQISTTKALALGLFGLVLSFLLVSTLGVGK